MLVHKTPSANQSIRSKSLLCSRIQIKFFLLERDFKPPQVFVHRINMTCIGDEIVEGFDSKILVGGPSQLELIICAHWAILR